LHQHWINVASTLVQRWYVTLIQRHFSTSIQLSNPTKIQRLFNVDMWRWSNVIFQHPFNFQIQLKFNVFSTLMVNVVSTLKQRWCACWECSVSESIRHVYSWNTMLMQGSINVEFSVSSTAILLAWYSVIQTYFMVGNSLQLCWQKRYMVYWQHYEKVW
jgi:hypothetical protein